MRAAPLATDVKPVQPGLSGGQYKPLTNAQIQKIEQTIYQILDEIGLSQAPTSGVAYMTAFGARQGNDGRLRFNRQVVDKALELAAKDITLYGRDPNFDLRLSGTRVHYGTAGAAVHLVDLKKNEYRDSELNDIYDAARIVQKMENIHFFQRPMVTAGMPVLLLSAGQAGATAPASVAGAVAQAVAEVLAGLVYVNGMIPGHPIIAGTWPFVSDLRTGSMSGGSGEQGLLTAACAQMLQHFGLPSGAAAGMADAKLPDAQSGYEKGLTLVMAGLSGLNMVYEAAGMHASLMGFCLESLVIDNDMLGQCLRCVRGVDVSD